MSVFFDNTEGKFTGMGIVTPDTCFFDCSQGVPLRVTIRDLAGNTISQKTVAQKKGVLNWMNLGADFPETVGKMGTFLVEPVQAFSVYLTGFSLQFAPNGAFTAITPYED